MKTNIKKSGLYNLIQYLRHNGDLDTNRTLRPRLREQNPKLAEAKERADQGDRSVFGIPDAATLQRWVIEMGRPTIVVVEGEKEPRIVRPGGWQAGPVQVEPEKPADGPVEQAELQSWFDLFEKSE